MPVILNEPLTFLQRACEVIQYCDLLQKADAEDDPIARMELVCAFICAGLSSNALRLAKPFNPLLYETFQYEHKLNDGSVVKAFVQQVSHHPPISAGHVEHDSFTFDFNVNPRIKFRGKFVEITPDGVSSIYLKSRNERYVSGGISCCVHNVIIGKLWFEHTGPFNVKCVDSNVETQLTFKSAGWFSQNDLHKFEGDIFKDGKTVRYIFGNWTQFIKSKANSGDEDSKLLWQQQAKHFSEYYNFTLFTMTLNEYDPKMEEILPRTDSRRRPDVRRLEEGDVDKASDEKNRLEDKQRANRAKDTRFNEPSSDFLWFELKDVPFTKEKFWQYDGKYWDSKKDSEIFPDIF